MKRVMVGLVWTLIVMAILSVSLYPFVLLFV